MIENIRTYFEKITPLSDAEWQIFSEKLVYREFPSHKIILKEGQRENFLSFVGKGVLRLYVERGETELTFDFAFENAFVSAYDSFLLQKPSDYFVQTLSDTALWSMSHAGLQQVYRETGVGNLIGRWAAEQLYLVKHKRELSLLNESAEQRYLHLLNDQSQLIQLIPLKYLASYIGITPQALSRIRKRIS